MVWYGEMWIAFKAIVSSPFKEKAVFWLIIPVLLLWIVIELYFDKHKKEQLGWNTALGNGVTLFWITVSLMKYLFENHRINFTWPKFIAVSLILLYGLFISYVAFNHVFPAKVTYLLASPTAVYYLSIVAVLWGYGSLIISKWVLLDLVIIFLIIVGVELLLRKLIPEAQEKSESESLDFGKEFSSDFTSTTTQEPTSESTSTSPAPRTNDFKF